VNIMSADRCGASCPAFYTAARHAVVGISTSLYRELDCMGSPVGVSLVCPARMDWHQQILCSEQHNGVSRRATEALHPKRLADEIFAAINTRRFWLFCDKSRADSPDLLEIRGVRGAEPQSSAAERDRPSQRRRFRSQTTVRSSAAFDPLAGAGRTGQPYQGIRAGSIGR
jgi:NAD(P)-dependent dehydrogenase (short-subunit alcohol dehydrogenase family)